MKQNKLFEITFSKKDDIDGIHKVAVQNCMNPWSRSQIEEELEYDFSILLSAKIAETVVGFVNVHVTEPEAHINELAVEKVYRRQGIAKALIEFCIDEVIKRGCQYITLEVRKGNEFAQAFYLKNDFSILGVRTGFYSDPTEDAVIMKRIIYK